jgi:hypothetical protein
MVVALHENIEGSSIIERFVKEWLNIGTIAEWIKNFTINRQTHFAKEITINKKSYIILSPICPI